MIVFNNNNDLNKKKMELRDSLVNMIDNYVNDTNTNDEKVIDPSYAWIIPTGAEKPVKIAFEGSAQVKSFDNRDWSTEIQTYQKFGVGTYMINPGICVYQNTSLLKTITPWHA